MSSNQITYNEKSFKDPVARVVKKDGTYFRYIFQDYQKEYDCLMQSGLYLKLVQNGLLIPHKEVEIDTNDCKIHKQLYPEQIEFQSYPFEWSFTQWRNVLISYIKINQIALEYGMILKDATPYNFYLKCGKPIMFDTSSFIFFKEGNTWLAYQQFCETMLAPLALMHYNGSKWAKLTQGSIHGMQLNFTSKQLPIKSWFNSCCLMHIHLHAKYVVKGEKIGNEKSKNSESNHKNILSKEKLLLIHKHLLGSVQKWKSAYKFENHWAGYYENDISSDQYIADKQQIVENWIKINKPQTVLDLGANTGKFSMIAANYAKHVIALEFDDICVDTIEEDLKKLKIQNISTLIGNLSEPSPSLGILNKEIDNIFVRANSEMVLGLALIHHLCISNYMSMQQVAELFAKFSNAYAIVEFIPKEDEKVQLLLKNREDIFEYYLEEEFTKQFANYFDLIEESALAESKRKLFLFKKR